MTQENSELTDSDLLVATRVFQKLKEFPELKHLAKKRPLMRDLFQLALHCLAPSEAQLKAMKKDKKVRMKQDDKQVLDNTLIRTGRAKKLVGNSSGSLPVDQPPQLKTIADLEQYSVEHDALKSDSPLPEPAEYQRLRYMRSCHICPARFKDIHQFYDQLCPKCAEFNYAKRSNSTNMTGRVCLVTGARVKVSNKTPHAQSRKLVANRVDFLALVLMQYQTRDPLDSEWGKAIPTL